VATIVLNIVGSSLMRGAFAGIPMWRVTKD